MEKDELNEFSGLADRVLADLMRRFMSGYYADNEKMAGLPRELKDQEKLIADLPHCPSHDENGKFIPRQDRDGFFNKMNQMKIFDDKVSETQLEMERERIKLVAERHKELYPQNEDQCPICLENVEITCLNSVQYFVCCGNFICFDCQRASVKVKGGRISMAITTCPLCRHDLIWDGKEMVSHVEDHAKKGRSWAQAQLGIYYLEGSSCAHGNAVHHKVDMKKALKFLKLAAEQRQPDAICIIAKCYADIYGEVEGIERCQIKARSMMKEAADLGNLQAQTNYALMCRLGQGGPEDTEEAAHYYTLIYAQKVLLGEVPEDMRKYFLGAARFLGTYYYYGDGGFTKNLYKAKYYLEEHVNESRKVGGYLSGNVIMYYAATLCELQERKYGLDDNGLPDFNIPGHSSLPKAMSLYRESAKTTEFSKDVLKQLEAHMKKACGNCGVDANDIHGKLKACGRCNCVWYCGKECQTEHWKAGHKIDCVRQKVG